MAEIAWASFKNLTQPFLPGCPWASIVEALQRSAAEFYERSHVWRTEPAVTFNTVAGQADYSPVLPGKIAKVSSVHIVNGHYLQKIRRGYINPQDYQDNGTPREYLEKNDTTITIFPTPGEVLTVAIDCSMKPDRITSTGIQDYLFQSHAERIASGAIYRLASTPIAAQWSNSELAAVHLQNFERGIDLAMARDMQSVKPRARPRMF